MEKGKNNEIEREREKGIKKERQGRKKGKREFEVPCLKYLPQRRWSVLRFQETEGRSNHALFIARRTARPSLCVPDIRMKKVHRGTRRNET